VTAPLPPIAAALSGRYAFEREVGAGGMATVYAARDLKHNRRVAVKVLRPDLGAVLGVERFLSEIQVTANLQHPNLLPLFDSGEAAGLLFYVMPFVEGESLRARLDREKQLPIDDAIRIAVSVASALDYAHRRGVIHRDLKPENILLHEGQPMVADFGIALAVSNAGGGRMTQTGLSLGTPQYMSPEQATADTDITARSDVYSLASVLYEMLAGEPPHMGTSAQQIIMKIISEPVAPVTARRKSVPPNVAAALENALEKLPADRFASAREFADALGNPAFTTRAARANAASTAGVNVLGKNVSWRSVAGVLATACVALVAWTIVNGGAPATSAAVIRAELNVLAHADSSADVSGLDISPDGSMIVYSARSGQADSGRLYLRRLDERTARPIPGTEGAKWPAFSLDGASIAYVHARTTIRRITVGGAGAENVVQGGERSDFRGLRWGADGFLYYRNAIGDDLLRVPALGGTPKTLVDNGAPQEPEPLPDGRHVLFTQCCNIDAEVSAVDVETGETRSLGVRARFVRYLPTGHLLLVAGDALRAVSFDAQSLTVRGEPRVLLDSAAANGTIESLATSRNGTASYVVRSLRGEWTGQKPVLVDLTGTEQRLALPDANYREFRFSPDGRRVAYASTPADSPNKWRLFVHDFVIGTTTQLTRTPADFVGHLLWLPSGKDLLYVADNSRDSITYIESIRADGTGTPDTLWRGRIRPGATEYLSPSSVTSDGKRVLLEREARGNVDLVVASLDPRLGPPTDYLIASWREENGRLSPDNRWVVYASNEETTPTAKAGQRVYVRAFPEPGVRFAVSDSAGNSPRWAPDGKTIYYWRGRTLVAASVATTPTFRVTGRRDLFTSVEFSGYDIGPDGKQFLMRAPSRTETDIGSKRPASEPMRLVVVANWIEEFRRKFGEQR
jgi:serine/threonine-protein kinase